MEQQVSQTTFNGWALVEIMGHRRAAGLVSTEFIGTAAFLRIVTPEVPPTEHTLDADAWVDGERCYAGSRIEISRPRGEILVGTGSIYAITPIPESAVLEHAPLGQKILEKAQRGCLPAAAIDESDETDSDAYEPVF